MPSLQYSTNYEGENIQEFESGKPKPHRTHFCYKNAPKNVRQNKRNKKNNNFSRHVVILVTKKASRHKKLLISGRSLKNG
jgi:hypothetical protein